VIETRHHLLLVSLLLWNAAANEILPLYLSNLVPEFVAIILSITLVLFIGEIIPAAVMTGALSRG
jgi:metal transporter CNNM